MFRGYVWVAARQFGSFEAYKARAPGGRETPPSLRDTFGKATGVKKVRPGSGRGGRWRR